MDLHFRIPPPNKKLELYSSAHPTSGLRRGNSATSPSRLSNGQKTHRPVGSCLVLGLCKRLGKQCVGKLPEPKASMDNDFVRHIQRFTWLIKGSELTEEKKYRSTHEKKSMRVCRGNSSVQTSATICGLRLLHIWLWIKTNGTILG